MKICLYYKPVFVALKKIVFHQLYALWQTSILKEMAQFNSSRF
jgi:hypothetical protein